MGFACVQPSKLRAGVCSKDRANTAIIVAGSVGNKSLQTTIEIAARYDNLGKGASGAAIQNMNIMLGVDEKIGLQF